MAVRRRDGRVAQRRVAAALRRRQVAAGAQEDVEVLGHRVLQTLTRRQVAAPRAEDAVNSRLRRRE